MTPVVDILPFVTPLTDPTLSETDFSVAVDDWNEALSKLLKHNNKAFWTDLLRNETLARFLNSFLGEYGSFRGTKGDAWIIELEEVVRRVFMVYRRIAETMAGLEAATVVAELSREQDGRDPGAALLDQGLLSTSVLMDLAGIYGSSDPEGVSKMVGTFLENAPRLLSDFSSSVSTVVQIIRRIQKRFEKGANGGAGKGKGKGKGVISPTVAHGSDAHGLDQEKMAEFVHYASALSDIAYALDAISAVSSILAIDLFRHSKFLDCLLGCYNYTLPVLSKVLIENQALGDINVRSVLLFLRVKMLSVVNNILDGISKDDLAMLKSEQEDNGMTTSMYEDTAAALTDRLCEVIVSLYEQSPLQDHMAPMDDAPLILDLEIQFSISEKLSDINVRAFKGENDRLDHWVVMLNDLRDFNPATRDYIYDHNMRKSEKMVREMSGLYMDDDRHRSSSTIISDTNGPRVNAVLTSADPDEDYVKRTILISQLQDLFPDLGDGFLEACFITFKDDPEAVTMHLLEENLPSDLATMDRSTPRAMPRRTESTPTSMALVKISEHEEDVLSSRRNIFDGDEFDVFAGKTVDQSKVSRGKKGPKDAEVILDDKSFVQQHKSAILEAVEAMYDDEYDDTYDSMGLNTAGTDFRSVEEVESIADRAMAKSATGSTESKIDPSIEYEEVLINMYTGQKEVFNRSADARRSKKRQELRNLTKMSDEQLEGWAIMFGRNPRKTEIAQKYAFNGQQTEIERAEPVSKRRGGRMPFVDQNAGPDKAQQPSGKASPQQQQQQQQRPQKKTQPATSQAHGQTQQGKGSTPSTKPSQPSPRPSQEQSSGNQNERAKNERQKSSKANHNRRNQHAKKMASMNP